MPVQAMPWPPELREVPDDRTPAQRAAAKALKSMVASALTMAELRHAERDQAAQAAVPKVWLVEATAGLVWNASRQVLAA